MALGKQVDFFGFLFPYHKTDIKIVGFPPAQVYLLSPSLVLGSQDTRVTVPLDSVSTLQIVARDYLCIVRSAR